MKKLTNAAQVAKLIKQQAKELGLKVTAKSQNFSMGNSVSVKILSGTDAAVEQLKKDTVKYEYGSFDGMTDSYHCDNVREDIPQTKYLFVDDDRAENIIKENLDQTETRFYEHRFTYNNVNCTSYQWLQKLKDEAEQDWQNVLKTLLQDFDAAGANSVTTQLNGFVFQITKKDKPEPNKIYSLTGAPGTKCIANGSTWKESEFKEKDTFDEIDHLEKKMLLNEQMEDN